MSSVRAHVTFASGGNINRTHKQRDVSVAQLGNMAPLIVIAFLQLRLALIVKLVRFREAMARWSVIHAKLENTLRVLRRLSAYAGVVVVPVNSERKPHLFLMVFVLVASMASISLQRTTALVAVAGAQAVHTAQLANSGTTLNRARRKATVKIVRSGKALQKRDQFRVSCAVQASMLLS